MARSARAAPASARRHCRRAAGLDVEHRRAAAGRAGRSGRRRAAPRTARRRRVARRRARHARARADRPGACSAGRRSTALAPAPGSSRASSPLASSEASSSQLRSKWFSSVFLLRPVTISTSVRPAATASSTTYWIAGLSTTGSISLGVALVAGRNRVPRPAAGTTALVTGARVRVVCHAPHPNGPGVPLTSVPPGTCQRSRPSPLAT